MSTLLDRLRQLQEFDKDIFRYRRYQRELPETVEQKNRELAGIQRSIDKKTESKNEAQGKIRTEDGEVKAIDDRIDKLRMQSNEVKTNREYKAFQNEIAGFNAQKDKIEEGMLEVYETIEGIDEDLAGLDEKKKAKLREVETAQRAVDSDSKDYDSKIGELEGKRKSIAVDVEEETLLLYEDLLEAKDGVALASVQGEVCQGCSFRLLPNVVNRLHEASDLVKCSHCGRFLYLVD